MKTEDKCHTNIRRALSIFEKISKNSPQIILSYSGGKDSTVTAILLYLWLEKNAKKNIEVNILHNDTLGELKPMKKWTIKFMKTLRKKITKLGYPIKLSVTFPEVIDTFYWRSIVRGYPAPTFKFRWCTYLLKLKPTNKFLTNICKSCEGKCPFILGIRKEESTQRTKIGGEFSPLLKGNSFLKIFPIYHWRKEEIWSFLFSMKKEFKLSPLFRLYANKNIRYGCWFCTVIPHQYANFVGMKNSWLELLRVTYRIVSDIPIFRKKKKQGYSKYGALNFIGRKIMWKSIFTIENLSKTKFYGLDRKINGNTLRETLLTLDVEQISQLDNSKRVQEITKMNKKIPPKYVTILQRKLKELNTKNRFIQDEMLSIFIDEIKE